jgi:hypothetical protein
MERLFLFLIIEIDRFISGNGDRSNAPSTERIAAIALKTALLSPASVLVIFLCTPIRKRLLLTAFRFIFLKST